MIYDNLVLRLPSKCNIIQLPFIDVERFAWDISYLRQRRIYDEFRIIVKDMLILAFFWKSASQYANNPYFHSNNKTSYVHHHWGLINLK